jgi:uncharacterized protein YndB with AHSA1/START domain
MDLAVSIVIARPVEVVFAYISNYEHDSQWRAGIIEMTQTPPGRAQIGTKTREVARFFGTKRVTPAEITQYEPDRKVAFAGLMANSIPVSGSHTVERRGEQTCFLYQAKVELSGFALLIEPLLAAILRRRFRSDLRCLKERLEGAVGLPS